jgi:hypothetical protein
MRAIYPSIAPSRRLLMMIVGMTAPGCRPPPGTRALSDPIESDLALYLFVLAA